MQLSTLEITSKRQRETNYPKYYTHMRGPVIWNSFLNKTKKNILSEHFFKRKTKEKISEFEEKLNFFQT